jgi:hypothetical protein
MGQWGAIQSSTQVCNGGEPDQLARCQRDRALRY